MGLCSGHFLVPPSDVIDIFPSFKLILFCHCFFFFLGGGEGGEGEIHITLEEELCQHLGVQMALQTRAEAVIGERESVREREVTQCSSCSSSA